MVSSVSIQRIQRWRDSRWLFPLVYATYLVVDLFGSGLLTRWVDNSFPGVFFYHLLPDESPGPLGDWNAVFFTVAASYLLFVVLLVPVALYLRIPRGAILLLAVVNVPAILTLFVIIAFGLGAFAT